MAVPSQHEPAIRQLLQDGRPRSLTDIAAEVGCSRQNAHRILKKYGQVVGRSRTGGDLWVLGEAEVVAGPGDVPRVGDTYRVVAARIVDGGVEVDLVHGGGARAITVVMP